jgi:hypothetical protein
MTIQTQNAGVSSAGYSPGVPVPSSAAAPVYETPSVAPAATPSSAAPVYEATPSVAPVYSAASSSASAYAAETPSPISSLGVISSVGAPFPVASIAQAGVSNYGVSTSAAAPVEYSPIATRKS